MCSSDLDVSVDGVKGCDLTSHNNPADKDNRLAAHMHMLAGRGMIIQEMGLFVSNYSHNNGNQFGVTICHSCSNHEVVHECSETHRYLGVEKIKNTLYNPKSF